jgi:hypothetical protein
MRFLVFLAVLAATPSFAVDPDSKAEMRAERVIKAIEDKGPIGFLGQLCRDVAEMDRYGRPRGNGATLEGDNIKVECDGSGKVEAVVLRRGWDGKIPRGTSWDMRQKDVWKHLKKEGLKDRMSKDEDNDGPYVRLKGDKTVTWRFADKKSALEKITIRD